MKNLILTGGIFHPFKESSLALEKILIKEGIESEITEDIEFGLKKIEEGDYDLMTVYALRWSMKNGSKYKPYRDQWEFNISASEITIDEKNNIKQRKWRSLLQDC